MTFAMISVIYFFIDETPWIKSPSGIHKDAEEEMDEEMPSCFLLMMFDCFFMKMKKILMPNSTDEFKDDAEDY